MPTHSAGRLSRGNGRDLDRLTLILPLTASGLIAEDDLASALTILLTYAPYSLDPAKFRPIHAQAIAILNQLTPPQPAPPVDAPPCPAP